MKNDSAFKLTVKKSTAAMVGGFIFVVIAVFYNFDAVKSIDSGVYEFTSRFISPFATMVFKFFSAAGSAVSIIIICVVLLIVPLLFWNNGGKIKLKLGIYVSLVMICSQALNTLLKNIFIRPRPDVLPLVLEKSFSFPSGHAMSSMCLFLTLALITRTELKDKRYANVIGFFLIVLTFLIGFSRIYLGVHYFTDVAAGFAAGAFVGLSSNIIYCFRFPNQ